MDIILSNEKPKYIQIYEQVAEMINTGHLKNNEKLPSKRDFALSLNVSLNTIINAYNLLLDEGYIYTKEKKGYYVTNQPILTKSTKVLVEEAPLENKIKFDFTTQNVEKFTNQNWKKMIKNVLDSNSYLHKSPLKGDIGLRKAICKHLYENKGIQTNYNQIIIGSGMEMFEQILSVINYDSITLENPGYHKLSYIAQNLNINISYLPLDNEGVLVPKHKTILYTTPFNQFPTGIKMSITRKKELIHWAKATNSYIIEDDFDAEFRINSAPTTSLYALDNEHIIFFSTFSTTLFPGLRISYAILPQKLLRDYELKFKAYSSFVATFEQIVLKEFILQGYYASHINRRKKLYLKKREACILTLSKYKNISIDTKRNYLSILIKLNTNLEDNYIIENLKEKGIYIQALSNFDYTNKNQHIFILGYTAIPYNDIENGIDTLIKEINGLN